MSAVRTVLVVGAGAAGTAAAILLAEGGVDVDLIDLKPDVGALGSGITLQGNALRVLRSLGVWDRVQELGYSLDSLGRDPAQWTGGQHAEWMTRLDVNMRRGAPLPSIALAAPDWPRSRCRSPEPRGGCGSQASSFGGTRGERRCTSRRGQPERLHG
jgi:NADPH-dependent 2,4-dienoyl-CoA reductase/sulfur reductase-like enzyme